MMKNEPEATMTFKLEVQGFADLGFIPKPNTCEGEDRSPAMHWSGVPQGTHSLALIVDDPDAFSGTWNLWLHRDLSSDLHALPEGVKPGSPGACRTNDFGKLGCGGPCRPKGHGPHPYYFKLFAVDVPHLGPSTGAWRSALDCELSKHTMAEARYSGKNEKK